MSNPAQNETFISLISAAKEDQEFANRLLMLTRLPDVERKARVLQVVEDCKTQHAPDDFINALLLLGEEAVARKVSESLLLSRQ